MKGLIGFFDILGYQNFLKNNSAEQSINKVFDIITSMPKIISDYSENWSKSIENHEIFSKFSKKYANEFIKNLLISIFIHNTTYIKTTDLFVLFKYLSVDKTLRLIQSDFLKLVDDNGLDTGLLVDADNKKFIGFFENSYLHPDRKKADDFDTSFDYLSFQVGKAPIPKEMKSALLFNVENKTILFDVDQTIEKIKKELDYDFLNGNITTKFGIENENIEDIKDENINKIFRL